MRGMASEGVLGCASCSARCAPTALKQGSLSLSLFFLFRFFFLGGGFRGWVFKERGSLIPLLKVS